MARDRLFINNKYRNTIKNWQDKGILSLNVTETKDIFLLAASLGIKDPIDIQGAKESYTLLSYIRTFDKAMMASILLGKAKNNDEIDKYSDEELWYSEAERCAERGLQILNEIFIEANDNEELLCKRLMNEIDLLYEANVKANV